MNKKTIIFDLCHVLLHYDPARPHGLPATKETFSRIKEGINILKKCFEQKDKNGNKKHQLLILSNATQQSYGILKEYFSDVLDYFDGKVISGHVGLVKHDAKIFHYTIQKYKLNPQHCIFIDDKEVNVKTAQAIGMNGINLF